MASGAALAIALLSNAAQAQASDAPQPGASDASGSGGQSAGDIVVTVQRRSERLREVPASVNVVTGAQIAAIGPVSGTGDLLGRIPGVRFADLQNPLLSEVSIRGSGSGRASGADPAVGLFANGVFVGGGGGWGRNFSLVDSFDVDRVEVLSGPQGALYGRNAEYGVVNLVSAPAAFETSGEVEGVYTFEKESYRLSSVVNTTLSDHWAVRLGAQVIEQDAGFVANPVRGDYYDVNKGWMGRGQLRYRDGATDISLIASLQRMTLPSYQQVATIEPGTNSSFPKGYFGDRYSIPIDERNRTSEDVDSFVLAGTHDLGWAQLSSTTSWRRRETRQERGFTNVTIDLATLAALQQQGIAGVYPLSGVDQWTQTKTWYQDLHLAGQAADDRLKWVAGIEYLNRAIATDSIRRDNPCGTVTVGRGICGGTPDAPVCYQLTPEATGCDGRFVNAFGSQDLTRGRYESGAIYGSASYDVTGNLTLSGEARYTRDHKRQDQVSYNLYTADVRTFPSGGTAQASPASFKDDAVTWTASAKYRIPGWDGLAYAKAGTGYRSGDFNTGFSPPVGADGRFLDGTTPPVGYAPVVASYGSERITSFEVGVKGNLTSSIFATLALYKSHMKNAIARASDGCLATNTCQVSAINYVINAGKVNAKGVEATLDGRFDVGEGRITLGLSGSWQKARYDDVPTASAGLNQASLNSLPIEGSLVPQNPEWLASVNAGLEQQVAANVRAFLNLQWHGQWGGVQDPVTLPIPAVPLHDYNTLDLRTGVSIGEGVELAFLVKNLTDTTYVQLEGTQAATAAQKALGYDYLTTSVRYNEPRTFALQAKYSW
jgi:iron complex outermembrane receptor protein